MAALSQPRRWVVIGTTGSGKSTFARRLGALLDLRVIELDALNWQPGWQEADRDEFRGAVEQATAGDGWVAEGGYSRVADLTWGRAEAIVWLDYAYPVILNRLFWRTLRRGLRREVLWNGNIERLWPHFTSRDSLFLWQLQTHWRRRPRFGRGWGGVRASVTAPLPSAAGGGGVVAGDGGVAEDPMRP